MGLLSSKSYSPYGKLTPRSSWTVPWAFLAVTLSYLGELVKMHYHFQIRNWTVSSFSWYWRSDFFRFLALKKKTRRRRVICVDGLYSPQILKLIPGRFSLYKSQSTGGYLYSSIRNSGSLRSITLSLLVWDTWKLIFFHWPSFLLFSLLLYIHRQSCKSLRLFVLSGSI